RRHTRFSRDWSSDVCSSDLLKSSDVLEACHSLIRKEVSFADHDRIFADDINKLRQLISSGRLLDEANQAAEAAGYSLSKTAYDRSEERRVGKEGRSRQVPEH